MSRSIFFDDTGMFCTLFHRVADFRDGTGAKVKNGGHSPLFLLPPLCLVRDFFLCRAETLKSVLRMSILNKETPKPDLNFSLSVYFAVRRFRFFLLHFRFVFFFPSAVFPSLQNVQRWILIEIVVHIFLLNPVDIQVKSNSSCFFTFGILPSSLCWVLNYAPKYLSPLPQLIASTESLWFWGSCLTLRAVGMIRRRSTSTFATEHWPCTGSWAPLKKPAATRDELGLGGFWSGFVGVHMEYKCGRQTPPRGKISRTILALNSLFSSWKPCFFIVMGFVSFSPSNIFSIPKNMIGDYLTPLIGFQRLPELSVSPFFPFRPPTSPSLSPSLTIVIPFSPQHSLTAARTLFLTLCNSLPRTLPNPTAGLRCPSPYSTRQGRGVTGGSPLGFEVGRFGGMFPFPRAPTFPKPPE